MFGVIWGLILADEVQTPVPTPDVTIELLPELQIEVAVYTDTLHVELVNE